MSNETNGVNNADSQTAEDNVGAVSDQAGDAPVNGPKDSPCEPALGLDELQQALAAAKAEATEFKDQYLRAKAEAENIRRRADQARITERKYAYEGFARELLEVRDSLDHAGNVDIPADMNDEHAAVISQLKAGVELTVKQMDTVLEKFHVAAVDPAPGDKFDPAIHQATGMTAADGIAANHVVTAFRKGYQLHDRLLRPAMVVVASGAAGAADSATGAESGATPPDAVETGGENESKA